MPIILVEHCDPQGGLTYSSDLAGGGAMRLSVELANVDARKEVVAPRRATTFDDNGPLVIVDRPEKEKEECVLLVWVN